MAREVPLPAPFDKLFRAIKEHHSEESMKRAVLLLETVMDELRRVTGMAEKMYDAMSPEEVETRAEAVRELLLDGARKAEATRAKDRIRRIGMILAGTVTAPGAIDADNVEEMMRIATFADFGSSRARKRGETTSRRRIGPVKDVSRRWIDLATRRSQPLLLMPHPRTGT